MTAPLLEKHAIDHLVGRLTSRYAGRYDEPTIRKTVEDLERQYAAVQVRAFVPVLVEREATRILNGGPDR